MADVFISYCSADRTRIGELAHALEKEGLSVWWDRALIGGASYETEIDAALSQAKAVVVGWTPAAVASDWVRSEADGARQEGKLVPVMLEAARVPRPFDRLHTIDMTKWQGDRGNQGFPEMAEAVKALVEGRVAKPIPWKRRITLAAVGSALIATITFIAAVTDLTETIGRWLAPNAFASQSANNLAASRSSPATQEGFREALSALAHSFDLRTQQALTVLQKHESRDEAIGALRSLAQDQSQAIDTQMRNAGNLWRQIGLLQFTSDPVAAREALERARRYQPDDPAILTALAALYQRAGRVTEGEEVSRRALAVGGLSRLDEARVRQVIGEALLDRGEAGAARAQFNTASQLADAESTGDSEHLVADLYIDQANAAFVTGDAAGALNQLDEAIAFASALPYPEAVAYMNYNAANVLIAGNRFQEADARLRAIEADDDLFLTLHVDLAEAAIASRRGEVQRALDMVENVRRRADTQQLLPTEYDALMQKAEYQVMLGQSSAGEQSAHAALQGWQDLQDGASATIASALEAYAISNEPGRAQQGCARLAAITVSNGYALAAREVARIRRLAHCQS